MKKKIFNSKLEELAHKRFQRVYFNMRRRCYFEKDPTYKYYGGRGIKVLEEWKHFKFFERDMWDEYISRIKKLGNARGLSTLDRIDVNGHYCKENCRWVSMAVQAKNRRPSSRVKNPLRLMADNAGINYSTFLDRLKRWGDTEKALSAPVQFKKQCK